MPRLTPRHILIILATILTLAVNTLANLIPFNGQTTAEVSDRIDSLFVPAGYVFSIWGAIYIGLVAYTIYQALPRQRENPLHGKIAPAYWIASLANSTWIFLWHYEFYTLTLAAMFTLLGALIYIYRQVSAAGGAHRWFVRYPFSVYLGWISVAAIANVSQVLTVLGWDGWGISPAAWAVIMIAVAVVLSLLMRWREDDQVYGLVVGWALVGIALEQSDTSLVAISAWVSLAVLAAGAVFIPMFRRKPAAA
jgi:hypothetical protein